MGKVPPNLLSWWEENRLEKEHSKNADLLDEGHQ
jgi:hypothetical protein